MQRRIGLLSFSVFIMLAAVAVYAQVNLQDFGISHNFDYVMVEDSQSDAGPLVGLQFDAVSTPLTMFDAMGENRVNVVDKISSLGVMGKWPVVPTVGLGFNMAVSSAEIDSRGKETGIGDVHLQAEKQIFDYKTDIVGLSVLGDIFVPTGEKDKFVSNGSLGVGFTFALERRWQYLSTVANIGYLTYSKARYENINLEQQIPLGFGIRIPMNDSFALNIEGKGIYLSEEKSFSGPGEAYLGGVFTAGHNSKIYVGASTSPVESDDSSSVRIVAGYKVMPWLERPGGDSKTVIERVETVKILDRCGPQTVTQNYSARRLTTAELQSFHVLPYRTTTQHSIHIKQLGEMTGFIDGVPYVADTQIIFAIDMAHMPKRSVIIKISSAHLKMDVRKVSADRSKDTEILCLLNDKVCSGEYFEHGSWKANIEPRFTEGKETPNDYFTKQYLEKPVVALKDKSVFAGDLVIPVDKLIENSLVRNIFEVLYEPKVETARTLYFLVADDTYVSNNVNLEIVMDIDNCQTTAPFENKEAKR